jgi:hypothetical protein
MDDPWNNRKHPHPLIYCLVIVVCAAILIAMLVPAIMGVRP